VVVGFADSLRAPAFLHPPEPFGDAFPLMLRWIPPRDRRTLPGEAIYDYF